MNAHAPLLKETMLALGVATFVLVMAVTAAVWLLRRKLVG